MYTAQQAFELAILTLCIWRESRGEIDLAKQAVGWTIRNRVKGNPWFGGSWVGVILKPYQFSSFNHTDPNATGIPNPDTDPSYSACLMAAKFAYDGTGSDPTEGAQYYYDDSIAAPAWAKTMTSTVKIGRLNFYREA